MIKATYTVLTFLLFSTMGNSSAKINLADYIRSFSWQKRIVLLIAKENNISVIEKTDDFFKKKSCENEARKLKYIRLVGEEVNKYTIPNRYKNKFGIWLIGYDGQDKSYSDDASLLKEIHSIIDSMPIRQDEMAKQNFNCK